MTGIARVLPRDWDAGRLLRFLAGLALIALSFTVHFGAPADRATHPAAHPAAAHSVAAPGATMPGTAFPRPATPSGVESAGEPHELSGAATRDEASTTATASTSGAAVVHPDVTPADGSAGGLRAVALPAGTAPGAHGSRAPPRL